jgi:hypothetical protein
MFHAVFEIAVFVVNINAFFCINKTRLVRSPGLTGIPGIDCIFEPLEHHQYPRNKSQTVIWGKNRTDPDAQSIKPIYLSLNP